MNPSFDFVPDPQGDPTLLPQSAPYDPAEARRSFSRLGLGYMVFMVVLLVASLAIQYAFLYLCPQYLNAWWFDWVLSLAPLYAVALPCLWLFLRRLPTTPPSVTYTTPEGGAEEKPPFTLKHWLILLSICLGLMYMGSIAGNVTMQILSAIMQYDYANALGQLVDESPVWMTFVGACICAPFGEELIFRKLLIDRARRFGDLPAILVSALLFALFHGNLFQFFYAFLLGMVMAYIYTRSGKYLWCVAMHSAINFVGTLMIPPLAALLPEDLTQRMTFLQQLLNQFLNAWCYGWIVVAIVLLCVLWKRRKLSRGESPLPRGEGARPVLVNPGMIGCLAVMILLILSNLIPRV